MSSNNRSYSTNRFLSKTNPEFIRGLADSGSVLNSPEINKLAAQMVDMNIYHSCKLWYHDGLLKERVSGPDTFVPTVYDVSGNTRDATMTLPANQPKLGSERIIFRRSENTRVQFTDYTLSASGTSTWMFWLNSNQGTLNDSNYIYGTVNIGINFLIQIGINTLIADGRTYAPFLMLRAPGGTFLQGGHIGTNICTGTWTHIVISVLPNSRLVKVHINGENKLVSYRQLNLAANAVFTPQYTSTIGGRNIRGALSSEVDADINDWRFFDTELTTAQIDDIYNHSKGYYGL
jgi:hypothetical protein